MSKRGMGRGSGERRSPGGVPRLTSVVLAAFAVSALITLVLPPSSADGGPRTLGSGPIVQGIELSPQPPAPPVVTVTATATDNVTGIGDAEFFIDAPGTPHSPLAFRMQPQDGRWGGGSEALVWANAYSLFTRDSALVPGPHLLYVHAMDALGTWGDFATLPFALLDPATAGPSTMSVTTAPTAIDAGTPLTVTANLLDGFHRNITEAELFFLDTPTAPGAGIAMSGVFGAPIVTATWTGIPALSTPGNHTVYVRGYNGDAWGAPLGASFTVRAPAFTLGLTASPATVRPGDLVTYAVSFDDRGNADAPLLWVNVTLAPALTYVSDTTSGNRTNGTRFLFRNILRGPHDFDIQARASSSATDGVALPAVATLDFTNANGWDFPAVFAAAAATVIAPEISLSLSAPTAYAGQAATVSVTISNTGQRVVPSLDLQVAGPAELAIMGDTAAAIGGAPRGVGAWHFANVALGLHAFTITEQVPASAADGTALAWTANASYLSRSGATATAFAQATGKVARPSFTVAAQLDVPQVSQGDRARITIRFTNEGSAMAASVRLTVVLPSALARVGGRLPTSAHGGELTWDFASVPPGTFAVSVLVEARETGEAVLPIALAYSSPDGVPLPPVTASATVAVGGSPRAILYASAGLAGAVAGVAALIVTERSKVSLLFLFLPLYTRLRHDHVLDHETRGMIRGYIVANPGDHYNAIKEALELPNGTLAYHIQVLQKEMIVKSVKDGKFRRFYPYEMRMPEGGQPTKIQRVILDLIRANPGMTPRDASGLLGLTSSTVSYHLDKLKELELIAYRREGISKRLYIRTGDQ